MAKTLSGPAWVSKFPNSARVDDLADPFKSKVTKFLAALKAAGASTSINATLRPKERAFLMHWSFRITKENFDPATVPEMAGVDIDWVSRQQGPKGPGRIQERRVFDGQRLRHRLSAGAGLTAQ